LNTRDVFFWVGREWCEVWNKWSDIVFNVRNYDLRSLSSKGIVFISFRLISRPAVDSDYFAVFRKYRSVTTAPQSVVGASYLSGTNRNPSGTSARFGTGRFAKIHRPATISQRVFRIRRRDLVFDPRVSESNEPGEILCGRTCRDSKHVNVTTNVQKLCRPFRSRRVNTTAVDIVRERHVVIVGSCARHDFLVRFRIFQTSHAVQRREENAKQDDHYAMQQHALSPCLPVRYGGILFFLFVCLLGVRSCFSKDATQRKQTLIMTDFWRANISFRIGHGDAARCGVRRGRCYACCYRAFECTTIVVAFEVQPSK